MKTRPTGTRLALLSVVGVVLAAVALAVAWYGVFHPWWRAPCTSGGTGVAAPGPGASPEQVVRTFVASINAGDTATTERMLAPTARDDLMRRPVNANILDPGISYVSNLCHVGAVEVWSESDAAADERVNGYAQQVAVRTSLVVKRKHPDYMQRDGSTVSVFFLGRNSTSEPWVIIGHGSGG